jgi:hypothetical protein
MAGSSRTGRRRIADLLWRARWSSGSLVPVRYSFGFGVPTEHSEEASALTQRLHDEGWASHVTVGGLLQGWEQLAAEVASYDATIDDYTNDLTGRDAVELVLDWASEGFRAWADERVTAADQQFRGRTEMDDEGAIGRYFRIENKDGWWWRRRPGGGPLGAYLDSP